MFLLLLLSTDHHAGKNKDDSSSWSWGAVGDEFEEEDEKDYRKFISQLKLPI